MVYDGLTSTFDQLHMVVQNSQVARELGISREDAGRLGRAVARASRGRTGRAAASTTSSSPVGDVTADESVRRDTTRREARVAQARLRSRGNDDRRQRARCERRCELRRSSAPRSGRAKRGLEPLATIVSQGYVADDFAYLARTPAKAGAMALERAGKTIADVQRVEINEAFASVALELDAAARRRRGGRERERRRDRARPSDRRVRRPDRRDDGARAAPLAAAASASRRSAPAAARATRC